MPGICDYPGNLQRPPLFTTVKTEGKEPKSKEKDGQTCGAYASALWALPAVTMASPYPGIDGRSLAKELSPSHESPPASLFDTQYGLSSPFSLSLTAFGSHRLLFDTLNANLLVSLLKFTRCGMTTRRRQGKLDKARKTRIGRLGDPQVGQIRSRNLCEEE